MKVRFFILLCASSALQARKTKISLYNNSSEGILVALDVKPRKPLLKDTINPKEAKNFFLPPLTPKQPYYFIIESSSYLEPKRFMVRLDPKTNKIILERNGYMMAEVPAIILRDMDKFLKVSYLGSLRPALPEAVFIS